MFYRMSNVAKLGLAVTFVLALVAVRLVEDGWQEFTARTQGLPHERREMDRLALPRIEEPLGEIVVYMQPNGEALFINMSTRTNDAFVYDCNGIPVEKTTTEITLMLRELRELGGYQRPFEHLCPPDHVMTVGRSP